MRAIALTIAVVLLLLSGSAAAQPDPRQKFSDARTFYDRGDYAGALALFRQIHEQSGSPNAHLYVARSLRELGRLPEAYRAMEAAYREAATKAKGEAKYALTRDAAAAELTLLADRVARLIVVLDDSAQGATVMVDGTPFDQLGVVVARVAKPTNVVASLPDRASVTRDVTLATGQLSVVTLAFPRREATAPQPQEPSVSLMTLGFVTGGIGLAGAAVFVGAGLASQQRYDRVAEACGGVQCTSLEQAGVIDEGQRLELAANIGLGIGIAGVVTGVTLIAVGAASQEPGPPVTAWLTPDGGGVGLTLRY